MKKITEYFTAEEMLNINVLAQQIKNELFPKSADVFELVFADVLFIAYQLRQSEEYMKSFNRIKATCDKLKKNTALHFWEALAVKSVFEGESENPKQAAIFATLHFILEI